MFTVEIKAFSEGYLVSSTQLGENFSPGSFQVAWENYVLQAVYIPGVDNPENW